MADKNYAPPAHRSSKRRRNIVILVVVVVLVVGGVFLWRYLGSYESTDDAQADVHLYPVSARVSGYVVRVNVDDNQWVQKGTVLVEIDPKDYEVAVAQAQANLENAEATAQSLNITVPITSVNTSSQLSFAASDIENANAGVIAAEKQLTAAHAQLEAAEANDVRAQDDLRRYKLLVDKREVSRADLRSGVGHGQVQHRDRGRSAAPMSRRRNNSCNRPGAAWRKPKRTTNMPRPGRSKFRQPKLACVRRSRMCSKSARCSSRPQLNLQYTKIVAPVTGEVNKTVVVGMNVQAGQQLLTVVPLDEVWVTANFKETQLKHMRVGQKAEIHVDSSGRTLKGHVDSIAGATGPLFSLLPPENATGNYVKIVQRIPVKIVLEPGENKDRRLRPGMNVVPDVYLK